MTANFSHLARSCAGHRRPSISESGCPSTWNPFYCAMRTHICPPSSGLLVMARVNLTRVNAFLSSFSLLQYRGKYFRHARAASLIVEHVFTFGIQHRNRSPPLRLNLLTFGVAGGEKRGFNGWCDAQCGTGDEI